MKPLRVLIFLLLLGSTGRGRAASVELNGLTSLFGENMAFLVLHQPGQPQPVNFALAEGESHLGVKLVSLDLAHHRARIEQAGQLLDLRLSSAPAISAADASPGTSSNYPTPRQLTAQEKLEIANFMQQDDAVRKIRDGQPVVNVVNVAGAVPATAAASNSGGASASSGSSASGAGNASGTAGNAPAAAGTSALAALGNGADPSTASGTPDYSQQYWYKTSLAIEQNRLATADQVANGELEPYPRTPLTPPNTPAGLVGSDTFFANRIPGYVQPVTVDN